MSASSVHDNEVRRYLDLPYRIVILHDEARDDLPWRAQVEELPGCAALGETPAQAAARVPAALAEWVADALAEGRDVPEPRSAREYSGKLLLRMPRTLHAALAQAAEREQVSLNAYITNQLAVAIGWRRPDPPAARAAQAQPQPRPDQRRGLSVALLINLTVVGIAAILAVLLLITAWRGA